MKNLILIAAVLSVWPLTSHALDSFSYSGRLVNNNGSPVAGPVDLRFDLSSTVPLAGTLCTKTVTGVQLSQGVFHVKLKFDPADCGGDTFQNVMEAIPSNQNMTYQVTDVTNSRTYAVQNMYAVPSSFMANFAKNLPQMGALPNQVLKWDDALKRWVPGSAGSGDGTVKTISTDSSLTGGPIMDTGTLAVAVGGITNTHLAGGIDPAKLAGVRDGSNYLKGDNTWGTFGADVLNTILTGLSTASSSVITATDSVLTAIGKLQGQASDLSDNKLDKTGGTLSVGTINGVPTPILPDQIVNKQYVDDQLGGVNSSQWLDAAPHIYFNTGNVGIGTGTPADKLDIVGNVALTGGVRLKDSGSNYVELRAPLTTAGVTFTLPATAGTNGQVLKTDGSGNLSWGNSSVGSSDITDGSIVDSDISATANIAQSKIANLTTDLAGKEPTITAGTTAQYWRGDKTWQTLNTDVVPEGATNKYYSNTLARGAISAASPISYNSGTGVVGMVPGTTGDLLRYDGSAWVPWAPNFLTAEADTLATVTGRGATTATAVSLNGGANFPGSGVWNASGNVGIGTNTPGAKLEVAGQVKITGGTPGAGKVLTSDAGGLATWEIPASIIPEGSISLHYVRVATTQNISLSGAQTIDGISLAVGDRVLVKNQTAINQNGVYEVAAGAWARVSDLDAWSELNGYEVIAREGSSFSGFRYSAIANASGTLGTSAIRFSPQGAGRENENIGIGVMALNEIANSDNVAIGAWSMTQATSAWSNVAVGNYSLQNLTSGNRNTAVGVDALLATTDGYQNTAVGNEALEDNTSGFNNTAVGKSALTNLTTGSGNTALGNLAGSAITTGTNNVVIGSNDGSTIATGSNNILISDGAGNLRMQVDSTGNVGIGAAATGGAKLQVQGQIKITGGTPGAGKVLTSDATGLASWTTVAGGTVTSVSGTAPIAVATGTTTPVVSISQANTTTDGYLSSADWNTFNNKQAPLSAGATINGVTYPANGTLPLQTTVSPVNLTDVVNLQALNTAIGGIPASVWTTNGSNIYNNNSGNVGVGISSPVAKLHVASSQAITHASTTNGGPNLYFMKFRNTYSSPQPVQSGDLLGAVNAGGVYNTSGNYSDEASSIQFVAAENFTTNEYGSSIIFKTTPINGAAATPRVIIDSEGSVGIGATTPGAKLEVAGQVKITGGSPGAGKVLTSDASGLATWTTPSTGADNLGNHIAGQNIQLGSYWLSGDGGNEGIFVNAAGNVGVGTNAPGDTLEINKNVAGLTSLSVKNPNSGSGSSAAWTVSSDSSSTYFEQKSSSAGTAGMANPNGGQLVSTGTGGLSIAATHSSGELRFFTGGSANAQKRMTILSSGDVGVGTATPGAKLEVAGQVKITGGTPGAGKVLTSDASGLATWTTPSTGADNLGNHIAGQNIQLGSYWLSGDGGNEGIRVDASGKVGIGTAAPSAELEIVKSTNDLIGAQITNPNTGSFAMSSLTLVGDQEQVYLQQFSSTAGAAYTGAPNGARLQSTGSGGLVIASAGSNADLRLFAGGQNLSNERITIKGSTGNVGIGTITPGAKLEVMGQVKITGGSPGAGKVLTSDASGLATWTTPSTGATNLNALTDADTPGTANVFVGTNAGNPSVTGSNNTALGYGALDTITSGNGNVAFGSGAGDQITTGGQNVAIGYNANDNADLSQSVAIGAYALAPTASVAIGHSARSTGSNTVLVGKNSSLEGSQSVGIGYGVSDNGATEGGMNVLIGYNVGYSSNLGNTNVIIGNDAGNAFAYGNNNILIGNNAEAPAASTSNHLNIGGALFGNLSTGNIGVGTNAPGAKLEVAGQVKITGGTPGAGKVLTSDASGLATWTTPTGSGDFKADGSVSMTGQFKAANGNFTNPGISFASNTTTGLVNGGTNLGVVVNATTVAAFYETAFESFFRMSTVNGTASSPGYGFGSSGGTGIFLPASNNLAFSTTSTERMRITNAGDVGIGTNAPGAKLEVAGQVKITGGTPGAGKVLTSDASGLATWETPSGGSGQWITTGSDISNPNAGNVGIGTTTPPLPFYVQNNGSSMVGTAYAITGARATSTAAGYGGIWLGYNTAGTGAIGPYYANTNTGLSFYTFNGGYGEAMRLTASGRLGLGTTAPQSKLDVSGGISVGTYSGTSAAPTNGMIVSGNVGIGTSSPNAKLQVNGAIASASINDTTPSSFDMSLGNYQYTATGCSGATWTLNNIVEGTSYTIAVQNNTHTGSCVFSDGSSTFKYKPTNATPAAGHVVYTFVKYGSFVYVSWIDGF